MTEEHKEECCSTKGKCCGGGKLIFAILIGLLLISFGYALGRGGCPFKVCPLSGQQQMMQK